MENHLLVKLTTPLAVLVAAIAFTHPAVPPALAAQATAPTSGKGSVMVAKVQKEGNRVFIAGLENVEWGNHTQRQNSAIAAATAALNAAGDSADYENLMGAGGAAFRVQWNWSPAAPHAQCGTNNLEPALAARGWSVRFIEIIKDGKDDPDAIARTRTEVVKSIDAGVAVLASSEECSLIVGYEDGGERFLVRPYSPKAPGYVEMKKWPWGVGILSKLGAAPSEKATAAGALRMAVQMAKTPKVDDMHSGFAAYEAWIADLEADRYTRPGKPPRPMSELNEREMFGAALANGYTYGSLSLARLFAHKYLRSIAGEMPPESRPHIAKAADLYERIDKLMMTPRGGIKCAWSLMPWDLKGGWTAEHRKTQAQILREVLALEREAIAEMQKALALAPPATR